MKRFLALILILCAALCLAAYAACAEGEETVTESTIAYWRFEEGEGTIMADETGNYYGSYMNYADNTWVETSDGHALNFFGSANQYVNVPTEEAFAPTSITVELFVKLDPPAKYKTDHRLFFKDIQYDIHIWNPTSDGSHQLLFMLETENDKSWIDRIGIDCSDLYDSEFHHIAFTYDGETGLMEAYVDYELVGEAQTKGGAIVNRDRDLYIGGAYWDGAPQQCSSSTIDEVRISNEKLDVSEFLGSTVEKTERAEVVYPKQKVLEYDFANNQAKDLSRRYNAVEHGITEDNYSEAGMVLTGDKQYLTVENCKLLDKLTSFTYETIVNFTPEMKHAGDVMIAFKDLSLMMNIWVNGDQTNLTFKASRTWSDWVIPFEIYDGQDHHIGVIYDDTTYTTKIYIDYREVGSYVADGPVSANRNPLFIGAGFWGGELQRPMEGTIKKVILYNYAIDKEQMTGYVIPAAVMGQWKFAQGEQDQSENPLTGELVGDAKIEDGYLVVNGAGALKSQNAGKLIASSLTMEAIVNFTPEQKSGDHWLFFKDLSYGLKIWVDGETARLITQLQTTGKAWAGDSTWTNVNALFDGQDHHVAMTYDAETGKICIYLDYQLIDEVQLVANSDAKGAVIPSDFDLYMGAGYWAGGLQQTMRGKMAEARISNYVVDVKDMLGNQQ